MRHGAFDSVDQQQHAVDHRKHTLDFSAKVGMAGGIDDVDVRALVVDRTILSDDGDSALPLQFVAVHDPFRNVLMRGEGARLHEQLVDERCFAVIDVGNDGDVAKATSGHGALRYQNVAF